MQMQIRSAVDHNPANSAGANGCAVVVRLMDESTSYWNSHLLRCTAAILFCSRHGDSPRMNPDSTSNRELGIIQEGCGKSSRSKENRVGF